MLDKNFALMLVSLCLATASNCGATVVLMNEVDTTTTWSADFTWEGTADQRIPAVDFPVFQNLPGIAEDQFLQVVPVATQGISPTFGTRILSSAGPDDPVVFGPGAVSSTGIYTDGFSGGTTNFSLMADFDNRTGSFCFSTISGQCAIPEPSAWLFLGMLSLGVALRARSRRVAQSRRVA